MDLSRFYQDVEIVMLKDIPLIDLIFYQIKP